MTDAHSRMVISPRWLLFAAVTFVFGFAVLSYLAVAIQREQPPIPRQVVTESGDVLFTHDDVMAGQHVFQKYGLMQYGTLFGHGAYLGPDFTAQYLHRATEAMLAFYAAQGLPRPAAEARVEGDAKINRYDAETGILVYTPAQAQALADMRRFYDAWFGAPVPAEELHRPHIADAAERDHLASYFSWAAWVATARRPGAEHSYTNNWPADELAGNRPTSR